jgi:uncharacterized protein (DUF1810 family)
VIDTVRAELDRGRKETHWMWFVFPQLRGLGRSAMARHYGISGREEAEAYLAHPVLGPRLAECAGRLLAHRGRSASAILGKTDAMKLRSCLTLFSAMPLADPVLAAFFEGPDPATRDRLAAEPPTSR